MRIEEQNSSFSLNPIFLVPILNLLFKYLCKSITPVKILFTCSINIFDICGQFLLALKKINDFESQFLISLYALSFSLNCVKNCIADCLPFFSQWLSIEFVKDSLTSNVWNMNLVLFRDVL